MEFYCTKVDGVLVKEDVVMYQSNAQWPLEVYHGMYGDGISTDTHSDWESAHAVCVALENEGFGGDGAKFPIKTWVSEIKP